MTAVWYNLARRNIMITKSELEQLLASTETYRVERTKSTTDKDKFGEAETGKSVVLAPVRMMV
jgi:hypothetical protein